MVAVRTRLVAALVTVTVAFGTTAPALSFTVPPMRPKMVCPCTLRLPQIIKNTIAQIPANRSVFQHRLVCVSHDLVASYEELGTNATGALLSKGVPVAPENTAVNLLIYYPEARRYFRIHSLTCFRPRRGVHSNRYWIVCSYPRSGLHLTHATRGAAKVGAAINAAAPRSRGDSLLELTLNGVRDGMFGQSSFGQRLAHGAFNQIPGSGNFATQIDTVGIDTLTIVPSPSPRKRAVA